MPELTAKILSRMDAAVNGSPTEVLDAEALALGQRLWESVGAGERDVSAEAVVALAALHWLRYLYLPQDSDSNDLETALFFFGKIAAVSPEALPSRVRSLIEASEAVQNSPAEMMSRATAILTRVKHSDDEPVDTAVDLMRRVRRMVPQDHPARRSVQESLATALFYRFQRTHRLADSDAVVDAGRDLVAAEDVDDGSHRSARSILGTALDARYVQTGDLADLTEAVELGRAVVVGCDEADASLAMYLANLCGRVCVLYQATGDDALLTEAVDMGRRSLARSSGTEPLNQLSALANLGAALKARFSLLHRNADLDEAVEIVGRAVRICPQSHPDRRAHLANQVDLLTMRAETGGIGALDVAITAGRLVLDSTPVGHPTRPQVAANVGLALRRRFTSAGNLSDLDEGMALEREAFDALEPNHRHWAAMSANVAMALQDRFAARGTRSDLDEAFGFAVAGLAATGEGNPSLAWRTQILASLLERRTTATGSSVDAAEALRLWGESSRIAVSPIRDRIQSAARGGIWALTGIADPEESLDCYTRAVELLDRLAWRGLERADREKALAEWPGLTPEAVSVAVDRGNAEAAIRLAEQGRAVLWSQLLDGRAGLTELRERAPALVERLSRISAELS